MRIESRVSSVQDVRIWLGCVQLFQESEGPALGLARDGLHGLLRSIELEVGVRRHHVDLGQPFDRELRAQTRVGKGVVVFDVESRRSVENGVIDTLGMVCRRDGQDPGVVSLLKYQYSGGTLSEIETAHQTIYFIQEERLSFLDQH